MKENWKKKSLYSYISVYVNNKKTEFSAAW